MTWAYSGSGELHLKVGVRNMSPPGQIQILRAFETKKEYSPDGSECEGT